jgi:outer membrane protein assembly factor BamB
LSTDGATLFALAQDSSATPKAYLVAMKRAPSSPPTGEKRWDVQLNGNLGFHPSLAIGTDGTIYLYVSQSGTAYLQAYDPSTGTKKWEKQLSGAVPSSASPIVDRQNNADIIYAASGTKLYAFNPDGSNKWASPLDLNGYSSYYSPLVGAETSGRHIIYLVGVNSSATNNFTTKIFAIADDQTVLWSRSPFAISLSAGFTLLDGRLFFTTYDGGEGQFIHLQGIKVSTPNMPLTAPWPKIYGNLRNSGETFPLSLADDYGAVP